MMRWKLFFAIFLCLVISIANAEIQKISANTDTVKLDRGELQTFISELKTAAGLVKKRVIGIVVINAPPAKVWKVLEDWEAMPAFVPGLVYYKVMHHISRDDLIIEGVVKAGLIKILYSMRVRFDRVRLTQEWSFISPEEVKAYNEKGIPLKKPAWNIKNVEGFEYIEPYGDGSRTIYYYAPVIEARGVPEWIERLLAKQGLEGYMLGVKKQAEAK
jgi:hypothetical protein